ncbi:MAG: hypothetical protein K2O35_07020, partial [Clostridia bacterium]|nr:hypothetical protein [Clostridia bacterium]
MNENFEKDIAKVMKEGITALEIKILQCLRNNSKDKDFVDLGEPVRFICYNQHSGIIKLQIKFSFTPGEVEFIEMIRKLPKEKLQLVEEYM